MDAAAMPLPRPEITPPVTKMYLLIGPPRRYFYPSDYIHREGRAQERGAGYFAGGVRRGPGVLIYTITIGIIGYRRA